MLPTLAPREVVPSVCLSHAVEGSDAAPGSFALAAGDYALRRDDLVVTRWPGQPGRPPLLKRLSAMPGDHIRFTNGVMRLNGRAVLRTRRPAWHGTVMYQPATLPRWTETLPGGRRHDIIFQPPNDGFPIENTPETLVPPGILFVTGDSRDNSMDSRSPEFGLVPFGNVVAVLTKSNPEVGAILERAAPSVIEKIAPGLLTPVQGGTSRRAALP